MGRRKLCRTEVIQQFRDKHGDFYDYSKFDYGGNRTKGIIICPHHGEFLQRPDHHKRGEGCPRCKAENKILSHDVVIQHFRGKHGDFYDYSKFVYRGKGVKGIIICPIHGEFEQSPNHHKAGRGCPRCKAEKISKGLTLSHDVVIQQFRDKHGDFYDYSKFDYVNNRTKGIIICPHHGEFEQTPDMHKRGNGCPRCKAEAIKGGYDNLTSEQRTQIKDVYLYHLELQYGETIFHKVGITGDPPRRFTKIQEESQSIIINGWTYMYRNAEVAFQKEQNILDYMMFDRSEKYRHPIKFAGYHECFLPVPNPNGWNLDINDIPPKSKRFKYNEVEDV